MKRSSWRWTNNVYIFRRGCCWWKYVIYRGKKHSCEILLELEGHSVLAGIVGHRIVYVEMLFTYRVIQIKCSIFRTKQSTNSLNKIRSISHQNRLKNKFFLAYWQFFIHPFLTCATLSRKFFNMFHKFLHILIYHFHHIFDLSLIFRNCWMVFWRI